MYLYYMEKILREAVREATRDPDRVFALPYWNYSDATNENARQIPQPYRFPADHTNPFFVADRNAVMNEGGLLPESAVHLDALFEYRKFSSTENSLSFGGLRSEHPEHNRRPHSPFESTPHDTVHGQVGGWMSSFTNAPRDPLFWLHHANIDRLWEVWLSLGEGRANPSGGTGGGPWLSQEFIFFDTDADAFVAMTGSQVLDTASQLGYRYDNLGIDDTGDGAQTQAEGAVRRRTTLAERSFDVSIGDVPVTLEIAIGDEPQGSQGELIISITGVQVDVAPVGYYEVYANLQEGEIPTFRSDAYLGNMTFFGLRPSEEAEYEYSLAETEQRLRASDLWDGRLKVTLVKVHPEPPAGGRRTTDGDDDAGVVQIGGIRIVRE